ncbi:MAG: hypothetical protein A2X03_19480 [Bacteroidetes bacterium GWA2_40_15]|nr:MAG: hypothetical protein A2X03_19480 [Bacteroidetes bacterium GWA2_40_15]
MKEIKWSRRSFIRSAGLSALALGTYQYSCSTSKKAAQTEVTPPAIQGFERDNQIVTNQAPWKPFSDRKIRVGIAGYGVCRFGADFGFQNHPNVEIVAVTDLFPDRCAELARVCGCSKTYPSIEEMVKDERIEAVFVATDAPSHAKHVIEALKYGKHVASAVPAVFGSMEDADMIYEAVKKSGLKYMMFETSCFHDALYAMRKIYYAGGLGKLVYSEGEYYHYMSEPIDSYKGWRIGGTSRMAVSWDTPGDEGERGRIRGERGYFYGKYQGPEKNLPDVRKPALPPGVPPGGHGGSHGYLMNDFVESILLDRTPLVNIAVALNMTVPGIVAHQSALKDGEVMKIPRYEL